MIALMAAGAALGAASSIIGAKNANEALIEAYKKQTQAVITNYNYNQKQLDMQEQSLYTQAQAQLQEITLNGMQNVSSVQAAVNEAGYEGNTKNKINSTVQGQALRQKTAVKENNELAVYQVRNQKQALYIQTQNQLDNMRDQTNSQVTGGGQMFMNALSGAAQGAALGSMAGGFAEAIGAGIDAASAAGTLSAGAPKFMQGFTEYWDQYWTDNSSMVNSLNSLSSGLGAVYSSNRRGY